MSVIVFDFMNADTYRPSEVHHINVMVELRLFGVAVPSEDGEYVALLLGSEEAAAQLVAGVGTVAAEIALHFGAQGGDVGGTHGVIEVIEAPGPTDDAQLLEHRTTLALTGCWEDGIAKLRTVGDSLARTVKHAAGGQRTVEETEDVTRGHVFETEGYVVVCHSSFFGLFHGFDHLLDKCHLLVAEAVLAIELAVDVGNGLGPVDVGSRGEVLEGDKLELVSHDVLSYEY